MTTVLSILSQVANESQTTIKEKILTTNAGCDELKRAFKFSYNKQITFGINVKTFPEVKTFLNSTSLKDTLDFLEQKLSTRSLSGNAAVETLASVLSLGSKDDYEVIRRILMRDLECGIGQTVANKVWKGLCPQQPQQLASPEDHELVEKIIKSGDAVAELKADGARAFCDIAIDESVSLYSRAGNEYQKLDQIRDACLNTTFRNWVVDGELVYRAKPSLMDQMIGDDDDIDVAKRQDGNGIVNKSLKGTISEHDAGCIVYQVWDIVPRDVYYGERKCSKTLTLRERRKFLNDFVNQCIDAGFDCIEIMEQHEIKTLDDAKKWYAFYHDQGYEGIIVKTNNNIWKDTRTKDFVKFKAKIRVDMRIVGVYPHKKDPNKLGGISVRSECGKIECDCGSGFTDTYQVKVKGKWVPIALEDRDELDRELLYTVKHNLIDSIVELECNGLSERKKVKPGEAPYSLYLPIMKLFRHDKDVANNLEDVFVL